MIFTRKDVYFWYSCLALTCEVFHAVLVLFQSICLNVAVNSHNKALLVIMVSNQVGTLVSNTVELQ